MSALLRIVAAVLAAIVFSVVYVIAFALESRRDRRVKLAVIPPEKRAASAPSERVP